MQNKNVFIKIDKQSKVPLYHQIIENLRLLIKNGTLEPGELTPSEWELSNLYGVSRLTVRRAIDDLERDGLLMRRHGVGTFVTNPTEAQIYPSELSFTKNMEQIGRTPGSRVVSLQTVSASTTVAESLKIEPDSPLFELVRLRLVNDTPLMLETTYLSQARFPGLTTADLSAGSLYHFLSSQYHIYIVAMDQAMEATLLTDHEATLLDVPLGSPAILSEIVGFTAEGDPIEYTWSVTCSGRGRFYFHFREGDIGKRHFTKKRATPIQRK